MTRPFDHEPAPLPEDVYRRAQDACAELHQHLLTGGDSAQKLNLLRRHRRALYDYDLALNGHVKQCDISGRYFDGIEEVPVKWIWHPYIPSGFITFVSGDPGCGKSQLAIWIAAHVISGDPFPAGPYDRIVPAVRGPVLYVTSEDSPEHTIKPRIVAAGCDPSKIAVIEGMLERESDQHDAVLRPFNVLDIARIERVLSETPASLIVVDPVQGHLPDGTNMNDNSEVRAALRLIPDVARRTGATFLFLRHRGKKRDGPGKLSGMGATDFTGIARSEIMCVEHPDIEGEWVASHVKHNLAPPGKPFRYRLAPFSYDKANNTFDTSRFEHLGIANIDIEAALHDETDTTPLDAAELFLREVLANGPIPSKDLESQSKEAGVARRTLMRARKTLGVLAVRVENRWCAQLPPG